MAQQHAFDSAQFKSFGVDFYGGVRLLNYIRTQTSQGMSAEQTIASLTPDAAFWHDDKYLMPVLENDALLGTIDDDFDDDEPPHVQDRYVTGEQELTDDILSPATAGQREAEGLMVIGRHVRFEDIASEGEEDFPDEEEVVQENQRLKREVMSLQKEVEHLRGLLTAESAPESAVLDQRTDSIASNPNEKHYFDSYSSFDIHEEMLKDEVRTAGYMNAILNNPDAFKDKVVLDIGCGTSILSLFAAKAGAKHVYGIDASEIAPKAREIVKLNGFEDRITIIQGKVEEIQLPVDKVDVIVSEWMGYCLLFESMLNTVLYARDKWLVTNGSIFPNITRLFVCAIEDPNYLESHQAFWDSIYGFNMGCMKNPKYLERPVVDVFPANQVISDPVEIKVLDAPCMGHNDVDFTSSFTLKMKRPGKFSGFLVYFDTEFSQNCQNPVTFSTGPFTKKTHWKQTMFYLSNDGQQLNVTVEEDEVVNGRFSCVRNSSNPRHLDISIEYQDQHVKGTRNYLLN
eukprot:GILK01004189.1.p1 GENE.GILK01004189.1~~GILK01004189.1.p1  ORF type:complete len:578 (-),score=132.58 GILK01004189.1:135-1673(-)